MNHDLLVIDFNNITRKKASSLYLGKPKQNEIMLADDTAESANPTRNNQIFRKSNKSKTSLPQSDGVAFLYY